MKFTSTIFDGLGFIEVRGVPVDQVQEINPELLPIRLVTGHEQDLDGIRLRGPAVVFKQESSWSITMIIPPAPERMPHAQAEAKALYDARRNPKEWDFSTGGGAG